MQSNMVSTRYKYPISDGELRRRLDAIQAEMKKDGVDCIVAQTQNAIFDRGIRYFIDQQTGGYSSALLIPAEGDMTLMIHGNDCDDAPIPAWGRNVGKLIMKPYCQPFTFSDNMAGEVMAREIAAKGYRKVGLFCRQCMALAFGDALRAGLPGVEFVDYSAAVDRLSAIKSAEEWELIEKSLRAHEQLIDAVPALKDQLEGVGMHMMGVQLGTSSVVMSKEPVNDINDLAGKRVITGTDAITDILTSVGATPLSFSNTEAYEALSKGTADAIASNSLSGAVGFGMQEVAKYVYDINLGVGPMLFTISNSAYDKLPADLQAIIDEIAREYVPDVVYKLYVLEEGKETTTMQTLEDAGVTIVEPTEEQVADFQAKYGEPIWDEWVAEREADGYSDARELMDTLVELCGKYAGTCPF